MKASQRDKETYTYLMNFSNEFFNIKKDDNLWLKAEKLKYQQKEFHRKRLSDKKKNEKEVNRILKFNAKYVLVYQRCMALGYIEQIDFEDKELPAPHTTQKYLALTEKGWDFIQNYQRNKWEKSIGKNQIILTVILAIGAIIAAWYYGIEILKYYHPSSH